MAHFYGTVEGQARTQASRRGSPKSGLTVTAASWMGAIEVVLTVNAQGQDVFTVRERPWHGHGQSRLIASGTLGS